RADRRRRSEELLETFGLADKLQVAGLAKGHEELYLPTRPDPVVLPRRSDGLHLMQRIRDEAHRYALSQHETQRRRAGLASQLDHVPGIGPARRRALIKAFGDLGAIRNAKLEELMAVPGISREIAERLKGTL
ncbi:excinuclease ABC subunit C, partial [bacterium]